MNTDEVAFYVGLGTLFYTIGGLEYAGTALLVASVVIIGMEAWTDAQ